MFRNDEGEIDDVALFWISFWILAGLGILSPFWLFPLVKLFGMPELIPMLMEIWKKGIVIFVLWFIGVCTILRLDTRKTSGIVTDKGAILATVFSIAMFLVWLFSAIAVK